MHIIKNGHEGIVRGGGILVGFTSDIMMVNLVFKKNAVISKKISSVYDLLRSVEKP